MRCSIGGCVANRPAIDAFVGEAMKNALSSLATRRSCWGSLSMPEEILLQRRRRARSGGR